MNLLFLLDNRPMLLLLSALVAALCPYSNLKPYDRPTGENTVCSEWTKNVCCDAEILAKIKQATTANMCQGCAANLENFLCYATCNPDLGVFAKPSLTVPITPLYCAASQMACGQEAVCSKDGLFNLEIQKLIPGAILMLFDDLEDLRPLASDCKVPVSRLGEFPSAMSTETALEPTRNRRFWFFVLISSVLVALLRRKPAKEKDERLPWANLHIDTRI